MKKPVYLNKFAQYFGLKILNIYIFFIVHFFNRLACRKDQFAVLLILYKLLLYWSRSTTVISAPLKGLSQRTCYYLIFTYKMQFSRQAEPRLK